VKVSEYLLARLAQAGLRHIFAVPGDYAMGFLDALDATDPPSPIKRVANVNELGSGYAADGYARFQGIGAACVQYGVGTFSLLNCTAGSYVERVPVMVISASPKRSDRELERWKGILFHHSTGDLRADQIVFENVTVASEILIDPLAAPAQIDGAITAMLTHRRPAYIEGAADVWSLDCGEPQGTLAALALPCDDASLAAAVEAAWAKIRAARLPVIWAGIEIARFGLAGTLQRLVDASGMLFTTTSLAKTVLDERQSQFVGTYAGPASPAVTRAVMEATDCPLALGAIITDDYLDIMRSSYGAMIEVTAEDCRIGYEHYRRVPLQRFLAALLERFESENARAPGPYAAPGVASEPAATAAPGDGLTYTVFYDELCAFLAGEKLLDDVVLVLGESTSLYVFGNLFGLPRDSFVSEAAWGSLGHETGSALGVALGSGKRPIVVAGDGGFRMVCQELSSLAAEQVNAVVFVISNGVYAIEQAFVDITAFQTGEFAPFDDLPAWDYLALATAFGARGHRVQTVQELRAVLIEVNGLVGVPALVEVVVPRTDLAPQLERLAQPPAGGRPTGRMTT
jgi:indolepyruvate decarboxylase